MINSHTRSIFLFSLLFINLLSNAQTADTSSKTLNLNEVNIIGVRSLKGLGHLTDEGNCLIYAGKKTEVLLLDSIDANTAQNNPRQLLGRLPGAVFSETEGSGFPSNGIGFRGVNPVQSIETNTRQNGYNISADLFGYNEAYFLPPLEAVEQIQVIRGAASLQFGPQFGGAINYIVKEAPKARPFEFTSEQTAGSYGFFNSFNSIGGTYKGFNYYGYFDFSTAQGWRANSDYRTYDGYLHLGYKINDRIKIGAEYTAMQNRIHMAGGLDDAQWAADPRASYRSRNWLSSPWNIVALTLDAKISDRVSFSWKNAYMHSSRNLVWRNEDGGPRTLDTINPLTNHYDTREVEREQFDNITSEARLSIHYNIGETKNIFAGGLRFYYAHMVRLEDGVGTTGTDFTMTIDSTGWGKNLLYTTTNLAPFFENIFQVTSRFSITPGFRFEFIHSTAAGYIVDNNSKLDATGSKNRYLPLAGIGLQYQATHTTQIYANISHAYHPIDYAALSPFGSSAVIDPNMKDAYGFNADLGFRGTLKNYLLFDINGFALLYDNTIGIIQKTDSAGNTYDFRTNVANSLHTGIETYVEIFPVKMITSNERYGQFSFYNSFSYVHAKYISGLYKGNWDENAPQFIERFGATYAIRGFSITYNFSYTSACFTDATNTAYNPNDATVGRIPSYIVMDISASYKFLKHFNVKGGINNVAGANYFTLRTNEYPGPGIIPSMGRSFYISLGARF
jgi:Fe(3+) dicitrate transport protein